MIFNTRFDTLNDLEEITDVRLNGTFIVLVTYAHIYKVCVDEYDDSIGSKIFSTSVHTNEVQWKCSM